MSKTTTKFSPEMRERAVRLVLDSEAAGAIGSSGSPNGQHASRWSAILSISTKIGCAPRRLNEWMKMADIDAISRRVPVLCKVELPPEIRTLTEAAI